MQGKKLHNTPETRRELVDALVRAQFNLDVAARSLGIRRQALIDRLMKVSRRPRVE